MPNFTIILAAYGGNGTIPTAIGALFVALLLFVVYFLRKSVRLYLPILALAFLVYATSLFIPNTFRWISNIIVLLIVLWAFREAVIDMQVRLQRYRVASKEREQGFLRLYICEHRRPPSPEK